MWRLGKEASWVRSRMVLSVSVVSKFSRELLVIKLCVEARGQCLSVVSVGESTRKLLINDFLD
jgi:hypothetical protein